MKILVQEAKLYTTPTLFESPNPHNRGAPSNIANSGSIIVLFTLFMDVFDCSQKMTFVKITKRQSMAWENPWRRHCFTLPSWISRNRRRKAVTWLRVRCLHGSFCLTMMKGNGYVIFVTEERNVL